MTCYTHELSATVNVSTNGIAVQVKGATLNSRAYYENSTDLIAREDQSDWLTDFTALSLTNTTGMDTDPDSTFIKGEDLQECIDMSECSWIAQRNNSRPCWHWEIPASFLKAVYDIFMMTNMGNCAVVAGNVGSFYYKYYPIEPNCNSTIHKKTITDAIQQVLKQSKDGYLRNAYFFRVNRDGLKQGDILFGTTVSIWFTVPKGDQYRGFIDIGCSRLQSPCSSSSQEEST